MTFTWQKDDYTAQLQADLSDCTYEITGTDGGETLRIL